MSWGYLIQTVLTIIFVLVAVNKVSKLRKIIDKKETTITELHQSNFRLRNEIFKLTRKLDNYERNK